MKNHLDISYDEEARSWSVNIPEKLGSTEFATYVKGHDDFKKWVNEGGLDSLGSLVDPKDLATLVEAIKEQFAIIDGKDASKNKELLEMLARGDDLLDHDGEACGMCCHLRIDAEVARAMLASGDLKDAMPRWSAESTKRWHETKFFKLWQSEREAGRDPYKAFEDNGWEP